MPTEKRALFIFAHCDDDVIPYHFIKKKVRSGYKTSIYFLTYGSIYENRGKKRKEETLAALNNLITAGLEVHFVGEILNVHDGSLLEHRKAVLDYLARTIENTEIDYLMTHAWEGGHHDHDACYLIVRKLLKTKSVKKAYEVPSYNNDHWTKMYFRIARFPRERNDFFIECIPFNDSFETLKQIKYYRTQWKTFLGLLPGLIRALVFHSKIPIAEIKANQPITRPHHGELLYERRFGRKFEEFQTILNEEF